MDPLSLIVGAVVAAAPVADGAGVPAPIVEQVVQSAQTDLPALTEQLPDPQPYVDQAVAAVDELRTQLPSGTTTQIGDQIADMQRQLPIDVQAAIPAAFLPPPPAAAPIPGPGAAPARPTDSVIAPIGESSGVAGVASPLPVIAGPAIAVPATTTTGMLPQGIPVAFLPALHSGASVCPRVGAPVLAAQLWVENGFRYGSSAPVSSVGAVGPAQFMPGTWAVWGRDYSGDGVADPTDVVDAVVSQAHLMCALVEEVDRGKVVGSLRGDSLGLALAAYNAGVGALVRYPSGGDSMPSGGDYTTQTRPYVAKILTAVPRFTLMLGLTDGDVAQPYTDAVVRAALATVGVPYVWGGNGPDAFDCSGLTRFAYAIGRQIVLPRTSQEQYTAGQRIGADQLRPGDLLFENFHTDGPHHVAVYVGADTMVEAPRPGQNVRISQVRPGMVAVRY